MNEKILLLEDDKAINNLLTRHLIKEDYRVNQFFNGQDVLENFNESYDLAILDIMVPKINGLEILKFIRKNSTIPILFLTAKSDELNKIQAFSSGADDYITKPFSIIEVIYRVKAQLRRTNEYSQLPQSSHLLINGPIKIDESSCKTFFNDELIDLSVKEYQLLTFFMKNLNQVFSKKQLYENVWKDFYYGADNTIMVHISRLREKLNDSSKKSKFIHTIKGLGYRMEKL